MSPLRFFTAEDPDMALVRAIRRQVFVQDLGVPEQQEFDAADLPGADTVYVLLTAEGSPLGTGRLQGAAENYKIGRIAFLPAARGQGSGRQLVTALVRRAVAQGAVRVPVDARLEAVGFYEKLGFVPCGGRRGFFLQYQEPVLENGTVLEDMQMLRWSKEEIEWTL